MNLEEVLKEAKAQQAIETAKKKRKPEKTQSPRDSASGSQTFEEAPAEEIRKEAVLVDSYANVRILKEPDEPLYTYDVPSPHYLGEEKALMNTLMEIATEVITEAGMEGLNKDEKKARYLKRILEIIDSTPELKIPIHAKQFYAEAVVKEMAGYGLIDPLIDDDNLEEIMIIGPKKPVFVFHRKYEMMKTTLIFYDDKDIRNLIDKMARLVGRRIDVQTPLLDARLPDGSRVNATVPPASISGATLTLRKFRKDPLTVMDLVRFNTLDFDVAAFLWLITDGFGARPANILIAGGTASGKTSTLNMLASFIPADERVLSIEDTAELSLPLRHWVRFETRPPSIEGSGEITMDSLVKNTLRMRPDRIIVGEVRGAEGFTLFTAMNTGHNGALKGDALVQLADGRIEEIGKIAEKAFAENPVVSEKGFEYAELSDPLEVVSWNKSTLRLENKKVSRVWRKKTSEKLSQISFTSGKSITLTKDHPLYRISEGIAETGAGNVNAGDFLALPSEINVGAHSGLFKPYLSVHGDGYIDSNSIQFVNKQAQLVDDFEEEIAGVSPHKITHMPYPNYTRSAVWDRQLTAKLQPEYGVPFGNKTKTFQLNGKLLSSDASEVASFLRGLYDCDGCVAMQANGVTLATANPDVARKVPILLLRYGINCGTYAAETDGKGTPGPYYSINIYGKENLEKFQTHIGFGHSLKAEKLQRLVQKAGESMDFIPNISQLLRSARIEAGLTQEQLGKAIGYSTRSVVHAYETGARKPTRRMLSRICRALGTPLSRQLGFLAQAPLRWEKVREVKEVASEGVVYDFTVEDNHTYVANGIIVSNCLGTVHANSAQETLVRLESPPISVPRIMITALNFILMQNRVHDRRKGVIRRVTEIAEVVVNDKGDPSINILYEWDAAKDKLMPTGMPCQFLRILSNFTGMNLEAINKEMEDRKDVLMRMNAEGLRGIDDVCQITQNYVLKKRGKI